MLRRVFGVVLGAAMAAASCSGDETSDAAGASAASGAGEAGAPSGLSGGPSAGGAEGDAGSSSAPRAGEGGLGDAGASVAGGSSGAAGQSSGGAGASAAAGESSSAGAAGAAGAPQCGELIENAGCADADLATQDFQSGEFQGCVHFRSASEGWVNYDGNGGFFYDLGTGLAWVIRPPTPMNRAQIAAFCADFEFAGSDAWRLPTIDEARVFSAGCSATEVEGTCALADPACLTQDCGFGALCESCKAHEGSYGQSKDYCPADAPFCISIATSSSCSDCGMDADWRNGPINGNFFTAGAAQTTFPVCVTSDVQRAVPCAP